MSGKGKFKKQLSLVDLTFIGLGAIFGSGWLFAASHVSAIAGPAGIFSWLLGGFAVLLLVLRLMVLSLYEVGRADRRWIRNPESPFIPVAA